MGSETGGHESFARDERLWPRHMKSEINNVNIFNRRIHLGKKLISVRLQLNCSYVPDLVE